MINYTPYLKFLSAIINEAVFVFLAFGALFGFIAGMLLLLDSSRAFRIGERMDRWISTRSSLRPLEAHRSIARPLYRMHRLVGLLICAGALYALAILGAPAGGTAISNALRTLGGTLRFSQWLSESLRIILLAGNAGAFVFGVLFVVRPSALKRLEAWADRRISGRKPSKPIEQMRRPGEQFVRTHPRLVGAAFAIGSLYVLLNLGYALLR